MLGELRIFEGLKLMDRRIYAGLVATTVDPGGSLAANNATLNLHIH
jgi:hypothetical protein